jgi:hypothetical protein
VVAKFNLFLSFMLTSLILLSQWSYIPKTKE